MSQSRDQLPITDSRLELAGACQNSQGGDHLAFINSASRVYNFSPE